MSELARGCCRSLMGEAHIPPCPGAAIIQLNANRLYSAAKFTADTEVGQFEASGTLCGHIDFIGPFQGTCPLSPDEAHGLIVMLQQARADVLENSDPNGDPRLVDRSPTLPLRLSGEAEGLETGGAAPGDKSAQPLLKALRALIEIDDGQCDVDADQFRARLQAARAAVSAFELAR